MFGLAQLGRLNCLVVCLHGFLQLELQVLPIRLKGLDLALPLFLCLPQPLVLLSQANILKAALLGRLGRRPEVSHGERVGRILCFQLLIEHGEGNGDRQLFLQAGGGSGVT